MLEKTRDEGSSTTVKDFIAFVSTEQSRQSEALQAWLTECH